MIAQIGLRVTIGFKVRASPRSKLGESRKIESS